LKSLESIILCMSIVIVHAWTTNNARQWIASEREPDRKWREEKSIKWREPTDRPPARPSRQHSSAFIMHDDDPTDRLCPSHLSSST
jgi:hypothetical protein